jgi:hypothetical protein
MLIGVITFLCPEKRLEPCGDRGHEMGEQQGRGSMEIRQKPEHAHRQMGHRLDTYDDAL